MMSFDQSNAANLKAVIDGNVILPMDSKYDECRTIWNAMFDRKPALIIQCTSIEDVAHAVKFGTQHNLLIAVRGGGHNSAGTSVCDDGLMIDLSLLNAIAVDPSNQTVKVQGGALLGDVDKATQEHGLAVSAGIVSHTGVGGLTLGGGFGWISRKHGLTIDNLLSVELVTAKGEIVTASETENPDLFWAVRGGGGNFGIATTFEFKAANIGTEIFCGPIVKSFDGMEEYLKFHRDYVRTMPDEMTITAVIRHAPPLPFLSEEVHGQLVVIVPFVWLGDKDQGEKLIQPVRDFGTTLGDGSGVYPWVDWQAAFDGLVSHGARNYWKSHHLTELSDECIAVLKHHALRLPTQECEIFIPHMEGAPSRISAEATAFPHRHTPFVLNVHTRWRDKVDDERCIQWAKEIHDDTNPFAQGVYVNFISQEGADRVKDAYTATVWERLVEVKKVWDPDNTFRMNQNIDPSNKH
ncbi:FAD-binding oxidoreductase [Puteibacter caeruleilacunae]|nr:FAD-binding oxidoreductase [Puteibacter caeruleilacunae]